MNRRTYVRLLAVVPVASRARADTAVPRVRIVTPHRRLLDVCVPATQIYIYERFQQQLDAVNYAPRLPTEVQIVAAEFANEYTDSRGYDPATYVEADLFGEEDTRSAMMRLITQRLTK